MNDKNPEISEYFETLREFLEIFRQPEPADDEGYITRRVLPDGREAAVVPLTYGRARLIVAEPGISLDRGWYDGY